jgi:hypothetical protein
VVVAMVAIVVGSDVDVMMTTSEIESYTEMAPLS